MNSSSIPITECQCSCPVSPWPIVRLLASIFCLLDLFGWFVLGELRRQQWLDNEYLNLTVAKCHRVIDEYNKAMDDAKETCEQAKLLGTMIDIKNARVDAMIQALVSQG